MDQSIVTRRKALAAAGAVGAAAALTGVRSVQAATGGAGAHSVTGTWLVTVTSAVTGRPASLSTVAFAAGGSLATIDNQAPGNVSLGAWEPDGGAGFRAVFDSFSFDQRGKFDGTAIIRPQGSVDGDGDHVHGTYTVAFKPPSGPTQHGVDHGTFTGSRLEP